MSKYSRVVCCVMGAHDVPGSFLKNYYANGCLTKIYTAPFWQWSYLSTTHAYFPLLPLKLPQENEWEMEWMRLRKLRRDSSWMRLVHDRENRSPLEDDSSGLVTLGFQEFRHISLFSVNAVRQWEERQPPPLWCRLPSCGFCRTGRIIIFRSNVQASNLWSKLPSR